MARSLESFTLSHAQADAASSTCGTSCCAAPEEDPVGGVGETVDCGGACRMPSAATAGGFCAALELIAKESSDGRYRRVLRHSGSSDPRGGRSLGWLLEDAAEAKPAAAPSLASFVRCFAA